MKYLTIGAVILLGVCAMASARHPSMTREMGFAALFTVLTWCMGAWGRFCEWRELRKVEKQFSGGLMSPGGIKRAHGKAWPFLLLLVGALKAKALFLFAVVAVGLGLIAWGVIELVYAAMSIHPRLQPPQHVRVTVSEPLGDVVLAASPVQPTETSEPTTVLMPDVYMPGRGVPWLVMRHGFFASGGRIEWSSNAVDWVPVEQSDPESQQGFWRAME